MEGLMTTSWLYPAQCLIKIRLGGWVMGVFLIGLQWGVAALGVLFVPR